MQTAAVSWSKVVLLPEFATHLAAPMESTLGSLKKKKPSAGKTRDSGTDSDLILFKINEITLV